MTKPANSKIVAFLIRFSLAVVRLAQAETIGAKVIGIADGDTIAVVGSFGQEMLIRLAGIDAPEHAQDYGKESAANLVQVHVLAVWQQHLQTLCP